MTSFAHNDDRRRYRPQWLPTREEPCIDELGVQRRPRRHLLGVAASTGVLRIPRVGRSTELRLRGVILVFGFNVAWVLGADSFQSWQARRSLNAVYSLSIGTALQGLFMCVALVVLASQPLPLCVGLALMPCIVGTSETESSLLFGILNLLAPLATVPIEELVAPMATLARARPSQQERC